MFEHPTGKAGLRLDRRRFFTVSTGAMGGVFMPRLWTGVSAGVASKSEKLNIAAIGVGNQGTWLGKWAAELGMWSPRVTSTLAGPPRLLARTSAKSTKIIASCWNAEIGCRHDCYARSLARENRRRCLEGRPGRVLRKAGHTDDRRRQDPLHGCPTDQAGVAGRHRPAERPADIASHCLGSQRPAGQNLVARVNLTYTSVRGLKAGPFPNTDPPPQLDWDMWLDHTPRFPSASSVSVPRASVAGWSIREVL